MAVSTDLTVAQDGGQGNIKIHPYLVTLVRWCMSSLWSTATLLLHRLMTTPLQPISGPKSQPARSKPPKRAAGTEHLHPEPRVECQVLHTPDVHTMDVIFVHGLYGSLGNTWRQGEWRQKYKNEPQKTPLRNHSTPSCGCRENSYDNLIYNENNDSYPNDAEMTLSKINEKLSKKIIPRENELITEQIYNNTLLDQVDVSDDYDVQAKFVSDLFKKENCDNNCDDNPNNDNTYDTKNKYDNDNDNNRRNNGNICNYDKDNENKCDFNEINDFNECICSSEEKKCEAGCGCICNDCYSSCWPKDWIKIDFPGARVISINYTSDPYLWRPLWIKENKRLNLYQRAEQMIDQLLALGVGQKPTIWVGHSKGGLFIKQIYCEAYEAHKKINNSSEENDQVTRKNTKKETNQEENGITADNIDAIISHFTHDDEYRRNSDINNCEGYNYNENNVNYMRNGDNIAISNKCVMNESETYKNVFEQVNENDVKISANNLEVNVCNLNDINGNGEFQNAEKENIEGSDEYKDRTSNIEEWRVKSLSSLYRNSRAFMFYSVPHRGSPLADIKTPVTARSVDLLEIAKDCPLVVTLQSRWELATKHSPSHISVRSFVESWRTLMSVLWLRIVSADSADAGIGTLFGINVDHREICKPSSRTCLLYTELTGLINEVLKCKCQ